jgi:hypothetical protein
MKRRSKAPSPAFVISLIALFVALGGTSLAATNVIATRHLDAIADTRLVKKLAPTLNVKRAKLAQTAAHAFAADQAGSADSATNAADLGGQPASFYAPRTLPSGQSETGEWLIETASTGGAAEAITFPTPLASVLDSSHVIYLSSPTGAHCPGVGSADPGYLCVYTSASAGVTFQNIAGHDDLPGADAYGFQIEFLATPSGGSASGAWTVTAP